MSKMCPFDGTKFSAVPGYIEGYGCPVCKGLSYHLEIETLAAKGESDGEEKAVQRHVRSVR